MAKVIPNVPLLEMEEEKVVGPWKEGWLRFKKSKATLVGTSIVLVFILLAIVGPYIAPYSMNDQHSVNRLAPPSSEHWFGTDDLGRDIFSRIVHGARISLTVGVTAVILSAVTGGFLGMIAGYYGRWIDMIIMRLFDMMFAFPRILLAIAIVTMLGPSLQNVLIAIAIINVPNFGRHMRKRVLVVKEQEYIHAARAIGMKNSRILWRYIVPNSVTPIFVQGTLAVATAIMEVAALGFLGLSVEATTPEWGNMIADARMFLLNAPWATIFPGLAIMLTVIGFNLMGDGLRNVLNPKMKN